MRDAQHVANDAADAGVRSAERFDGRRMVVGLGLERDRGALGELDDAGIADERRPHERCIDRFGAPAELSHQRGDLGRSVGPAGGVDDRTERLVGAVLAPRLGECLDLDVGDVAAKAFVLVADHTEFLEVEVQRTLDVQRHEAVVVEAADRDQFGVRVSRRVVEVRRLDEPVSPTLDDRVRDDSTHDLVGEIGIDGGSELDPAGGGRGREFDAELQRGVHHCVGSSVGDAGEERDLDAIRLWGVPAGVLQERVGDRCGESCSLIVIESARDMDHVGHLNGVRQ